MERVRHTPPPTPQLNWAFFLDVDGTLLSLAKTPQAVLVEEPLLQLIASLHAACGGALAAWWVRETRCRNIWQG